MHTPSAGSDALRGCLDEMRGMWRNGSDEWFHNGVKQIDALRAVLDITTSARTVGAAPLVAWAEVIESVIAEKLMTDDMHQRITQWYCESWDDDCCPDMPCPRCQERIDEPEDLTGSPG